MCQFALSGIKGLIYFILSGSLAFLHSQLFQGVLINGEMVIMVNVAVVVLKECRSLC